jgi:glycine/D-amino acid oxidase-like deaminating enzyme
MADSERKSIVIVGGGIIGCTTAYFITRHPKYNPDLHSIHLLEATGIASGASGKAGGLLALWAYPQALVPLSFKLHADLAKEHDGARRWGYRGVGVGQIELKGRQLTGKENVITQRGVVDGEASASAGDATEQVDGRGGAVRGIHRADVASDGNVDPDPDISRVSLQKRSQASYANMRKAGLPDDLDWVAEECALAYESMGSPKDTAQVHPYQFTTSMAALAEEKGARIIVGASVDTIEPGAAGHVVHYTHTNTGTDSAPSSRAARDDGEAKSLHATDVIITAGPWTRTVWPGTPISALRAHSVTIRPSRPLSAYCLFTSLSLPRKFKPGGGPRGVSHVTPEIYARPNNEVYACGEGDHLVDLPRSAADVEVDDSRCQDIVDYCASFSDELRDGHVLIRQACYLPQVESGGGPLVGRTNTPGVFIAAGHTCWGIQNGPGTGKLMSEFVFDGSAGSADVRGLDPRRVLR